MFRGSWVLGFALLGILFVPLVIAEGPDQSEREILIETLRDPPPESRSPVEHSFGKLGNIQANGKEGDMVVVPPGPVEVTVSAAVGSGKNEGDAQLFATVIEVRNKSSHRVAYKVQSISVPIGLTDCFTILGGFQAKLGEEYSVTAMSLQSATDKPDEWIRHDKKKMKVLVLTDQ